MAELLSGVTNVYGRTKSNRKYLSFRFVVLLLLPLLGER